MKKCVALISILFVFCISTLTGLNTAIAAGSFDRSPTVSEPNEDLFKSIIIALLYPHVENAINEYYDDYLSFLPREDPWSYEFISFDRMSGSFRYLIKLQVAPYIGPHISVGRDQITVKVDLYGVQIRKFEHLESYELPPHYQNIIINKYPTG